jgi:hypothetical protein
VIDICDREADMYEYLDYQVSHDHRFVVRAKEDRRLTTPKSKVSDVLEKQKPMGYLVVTIPQKGGRKARQAKLAINYAVVTLKRPELSPGSDSLSLKVVQCWEVGAKQSKQPLCWKLYTTESIESFEDLQKIVRYYELRWRIEEFHKVWKSDGTQVESLRLQTCDNLKRLATILAFVAVRLYQIRDAVQHKQAQRESCQPYFSPVAWKLLWKATEKQKPLPKTPPTLYWAYYAIAKLGGWYDSKRNGRVGIPTFWRGWMKLATMVESYELTKGLDLH